MTIPTEIAHSGATATDGYSLRAELHEIEADCPGWHLWLDTGGRINATHVYSRAEGAAAAAHLRGLYLGSGITLDAGCPSTMKWKIADWQHHWACGLHKTAGAA